MKKTMLFVAVASLAMASCSKEETTGTNAGRGIDFRAGFATTRAVETTTTNLSSFYVSAFNGSAVYDGMTDVEFTFDGSYFTSTPEHYWPTNEDLISFFAYSPSKSEIGGTMNIRYNTKQLSNFRPNTDVSKQVDVVYAMAEGDKNDEATGVQLNFEHILSQVGILGKNTGEFIYNVAGVKIGKPVGTGAYNFVNTRWTPSSTSSAKVDYVIEYDSAPIELGRSAKSLMGKAGNAMLIPQTLEPWDSENDKTNGANGAYLSVKVNIQNADGDVLYPRDGTIDDYGWVAVPINTQWEAGSKYIYTLDFSKGTGVIDPDDPENPGENVLGSAIKFEVEVSEWTDAGQNITM